MQRMICSRVAPILFAVINLHRNALCGEIITLFGTCHATLPEKNILIMRQILANLTLDACRSY